MLKTAFLALAAIFLFVSTAQPQTPLRIAYPSYPPFHWVKEDGAMAGFFYEIITEALVNRMGVTVVWTEYPWPRCQENLKAGKDDAIMTVPTAERLTYAITHKDPFYQKKLNVFTYAGHPKIKDIYNLKTIKDIKEHDFSVITYTGNGWHNNNVQSLGIVTYETAYLENVWRMLAGKRGDLVIEWPPGAWPDMIRAGVTDKVLNTHVEIGQMPFHFIIRKNSYYIYVLDKLDDIVKKMYEDGTMTLIMSKYY
ncbi:MAG: substrate-binding periplasmic protein [Syntrophobacteraceae bacterium]